MMGFLPEILFKKNTCEIKAKASMLDVCLVEEGFHPGVGAGAGAG